MEKYEGFDDWEDVLKQFCVSDEELARLVGAQPILCVYDTPAWEGYGYVLYRDAEGKLMEAVGSHCSCHGLEDQWDPEETSYEALAMREHPYGVSSEAWQAMLAFVKPAEEPACP